MSTPPLRIEVTARPDTLGVIRSALRSWLSELGIDARAADEVLLGVDEAVTNCVEHAYRSAAPGPVVVTATLVDARTVRVTVRDHGRWLPPTPTPALGGVPLRGRGLDILRALSAHVHLDPGPDGTTVTADFTDPAA
ncbi:ATP-binding protein [Actinokineospora enzanensis]|uniref:ATP-binding protein n=1 Tax=Actinokineospora enzanensis TaxID=155975 RepID=UPI000366545B|nr:ATP-binding protein [Actinokineospora enzanensis]